jgi:hypothetical protein
MEIVEYDGIVRQVIDAVNAAYEDGDVPTVSEIYLNDAEMDTFLLRNPFLGDIGKFYGDEDVMSIRNIVRYSGTAESDGVSAVASFYLNGIRIVRKGD